MNTKILVLLCCCGLLASCLDDREIRLSGKISNLNGQKIVYYRSTDGMFDSQLCDTLEMTSDSTYTLTIPGTKRERIRFVLWGKRLLGNVILKGGLPNEMDIDVMAESPLTVKRASLEERKVFGMLDRLDNNIYELITKKGDVWNISNDTAACSVATKLKDYALLKDKEMEGFEQSLREKARHDVRMQIMLAFQNQLFKNIYLCPKETKHLWFEEWEKMMGFCEANHPDSPISPAFFDVVYNNAGITYRLCKTPKPEGVKDRVEDLVFHYFEHNLKGKAQESAMAQLFLNDEAKENNYPGIDPLYGRFKQLHPQSRLMPHVEKAVAKNRKFNRTKTPEYIHFPNTGKARTFKEILGRYKGKTVFLDIWATWCGPCRESFAFVKPLQEYARQHDDIVLLYLSIDSPEDDAKWRKMAVHYDLMGEHVRTQKAFIDEIYKTFGDKYKVLSIPRCVIFDKDGKMRFKSAASPQDFDKLKSQLEQAAK